MSLKQQALKGVIWSAIERFSVQGIQFVLSFIIARQLFPSDYGLIAMLTIFMAIAQSFIDSGFSNALIQKQDRTQTDYSTVFYFNIIVGIIAYVILILFSPLISSFYDQPILKEIIAWSGLNLVISSFSTVQRAILTIELNFKKQAIIALVSVITSGVAAVYMAYNGYGVWTLVFQGIINGFVNVLLLWLTTKWYPTLEFSIKSFKQMFSFGSKILCTGLLHTIYVNLYSIVIGKVYPIEQLGLFNRAHSISLYPSQFIVNTLRTVIYPVLCKLQNNDKILEDKFILLLKLSVYIFFPVMIGLFVLAEPLIQLLLTEKWISCVPYLRILCFAYILDPIMVLPCLLLNARGRSDYYLRAEILKKIVAVIILSITIPFGIKIMCIGLIVYSLIDITIISSFTKKILPSITLLKYISLIFPTLMQSLSMGIVIYLFSTFIDDIILKLFLSIVSGVIVYFLLSYIFNYDIFKKTLSFVAKCHNKHE